MAPGWQLQDIIIGALRVAIRVMFRISGSCDFDLGVPGLIRVACGLRSVVFGDCGFGPQVHRCGVEWPGAVAE